MTTTWNLYGSGTRSADRWPQLVASARWTAAWADLAGFHLAPLPDELPAATTHLWAWAPGRWLRVRIDGPQWWAAVLTERDWDRDAELWRSSSPLGQPMIAPVHHWGARESKVKQYRGSGGVLDVHDTVQLIPLRPATATFLGHRTTLPDELRPAS